MKTIEKNIFDAVVKHYLIACDWADKPEGTNPRITKSSKFVARAFVADFVETCEKSGGLFSKAMAREEYGFSAMADGCPRLTANAAAFGHDVWLTCAGHGVGFWDRSALDDDNLGNDLTAICSGLHVPSVDFYRGWLNLSRWNPVTQKMYATS